MLTRKESDFFRSHYLILEDVYDRVLEKTESPEMGIEDESWIRELKAKRGPQFINYFTPYIEDILTLAIKLEYLSESYIGFSRYLKRIRLLEYVRDPESPRPKNYNKYLDSARWSNLRKHILIRDGFLCICGRPAVDVHHKTYERTGKEYFSDLVALCRSCHDLIHLIRDRDKDPPKESIEYRL